MADDDKTLQVEIALLDSISPALSSIQQNLSKLNEALSKLGAAADNSVGKVSSPIRQVHERARNATRSAGEVTSLFGVMSKAFGAVSVVVGGIQIASRQFQRFAKDMSETRNASRDAGFTMGQLSELQLRYERAGEKAGKADEALANVGETFDELVKNQTASDFFQKYHRYNADVADSLVVLSQQGKRWEMLMKIRDDYFRDPNATRYQAQIREVTHTTSLFWDLLKDKMEGAPRYWTPPIEHVDEYNRRLTIIETKWENIKKSIQMRAVASTEGDPEKRKKFFDEIRKQEGTIHVPLPGVPGTFPEDMSEEKKESNRLIKAIRDSFGRLFGDTVKRQEGGDVSAGKSYVVGEAGPELLQSSGGYQLIGARGPEIIRPAGRGRVFGNEGEYRLAGEGGPAYQPTAEENWTALNAMLKDPMRAPFPGGREEGDPYGQRSGTNLFGDPMYDYLKEREMSMEQGEGYEMWGGSGGFETYMTFKKFYGHYQQREQPISETLDRANRNEMYGAPQSRTNLRMEFENVPPGVKIDTSNDGYDGFSVSKSKQIHYRGI